MALISVNNLTFSYKGSYDNIFEDVSLQMDTSWQLGFTGRNGRGKTTFLKLLLGEYEYEGSIASSVAFEYFPFDIKNKSLNTIEIMQSVYPDSQLWEIEKELSLLKVSPDVLYRPFETLSYGEQTKVMLAALFLKPQSFLLIDEPTNHLDMQARKNLARYLNSKAGFILVSHDRALLDCCIDHVLSINKTNIEIQRGNFSSWQINKQLEDDFETEKNIKLKKDIVRLKKAALKTAGWSDKLESTKIGGHVFDRGAVGHKAAKMMKRSKSVERRQEKAAEEKSQLLKNIETADNLAISPVVHHSTNLLEVKDVEIIYDGNVICQPISFSLNTGDRLAVTGGNGCGKSSILKIITGEDIAYNGIIRQASGLKISYVSQDTSHLSGNLTDYAEKYGIEDSLFKAILSKMGFESIQFEKDMDDFSAGQKKKVLIARSLCEKAHLYIWDEPLNFIDIISRIQVEELILRYQPTMIFVEHDSSFYSNVATKICTVKRLPARVSPMDL